MIPKNGEVWEFRSSNSWEKMLVNHTSPHGYSDSLNVIVLDSSIPSETGKIKQYLFWLHDKHCWKRIS